MAATSNELDRGDGNSTRFAWLTVILATWILLGLALVSWALNKGLATDVGSSPYHIPGYLGLATLGVFSLVLVGRGVRSGRHWYQAFPPGYGTLGAGLVVILAFIVADVGWREGVGIAQFGIENWLAPTRVLLVVGIFLIAVAPLRARLISGPAGKGPWPAVLSTSFVLALVWGASLHPATNPWMERAAIDQNSEIWAMDVDGAHQTRLIQSGGGVAAWNPVLSPDGTMIAYSHLAQRDPPDAIPQDADIWVANIDGSGARPLVVREGFQWLPHWSPDGTWIAFTDEPAGGPWTASGPQGLEGGNGLLGLGFGPGSTTPVRQYAKIWRVRADGTGSPERLTDSAGDDRAAAYSRDGKRLVFDSSRDGNTQIYIMDADGSNQRRLTQDDSDDWGATWSPTGMQVAFNAAFSGEMQIYVLGVDGNGPLTPIALTTDSGAHITPSWSPDGAHLVFAFQGAGPNGACEIRSIEVSGTGAQDLTRSPGACEDLTSGGGAWGPNGRIVYVRSEDQAANTSPLVREDLAAASVLLMALLLAIVAAVISRIDPPFGSFAIIMGIATAFAASQSEQWRFIPAAVAGGLLVDVLVRLSPGHRIARVAGAASAVAFVVGLAATVGLTAGLGWSPTLLGGVVAGSGVLGWSVGALLGPGDKGPEAVG